MGPDFVVVLTPRLHLFASVVKAHEPVRIEALRPELAVERLDEGIVGRLAGSGEIERDALLVGPEVEVARDKFRALVNPNGPWVAHADVAEPSAHATA